MKLLGKIWLWVSILFYFVAIGTWITIPEEKLLNFVITLIPTVGLLFFLLQNQEWFSRKISSHYSQNLFSHIINFFLIFCVSSLLQYLVYKNSYFWDLTREGKYTLSVQTKEILKAMPSNLEFHYFAKRSLWDTTLPDLKLYEHEKENLTVIAHDIDAEPALVEKYHIQKDNSLVIFYEGASRIVSPLNHLNIANALLKMIHSKEVKVYFTQGHDESEIESDQRNGLSKLINYIKNSSYQLSSLDLMKRGIPHDASAIVIIGPKKEFLPQEIKMLREYIAKGGKLLISLGPQLGEDNLKNLRNFLKEYSLVIKNTIVVDMLAKNYQADATVAVIKHFDKTHSITKGFEGRVFFPLSSSIETTDSEKAKILAYTNSFPATWAETDLKGVLSGKAKYDTKDIKGPIGIMAYVAGENESKIVLFSNKTFVENIYYKQGSNYNLFLNSLSWLVDDNPITSFNRPQIENSLVMMSAGQVQLIFYFTVVFLPLILFGIAIFLYKRKQHL